MTAALLPLSAMPKIEWPAVPSPAGASMLALQWQLEQAERAPAPAIRAGQLEQLRALLAHAVAHVPRYRTLLRDIGIRSAAELDEQRFLSLPILSKETVRAERDALLAAKWPASHGDGFDVPTSGSTGQPVRVRHTRVSEFFFHALVVREHLLHRRDLSRKFGAIRLAAAKRSSPEWGVMSAMFATGPSCVIDALAGVDAQLDWLLAEQPAYLIGHPTNLRALIQQANAANRRPPGLLQLLAFGETLPPDLRAMAREAWGVPVVDNYSCREVGPLAFQCPEGAAYHVHAENVLLEVLRKDGTPCAPGETGRVVVTPLHNFAMPLLRYEIGDYAEVAAPCACGRTLPALGRILGRSTAMAVDPTGRRFWPGLRASLLTPIAPFRQLRLVQHAVDRIELLYVMDRELSAPERAAVAGALAEMLGYAFHFDLTRASALERSAGGKFEDFISRVQGP
ncbi:MAG TPA: AMP-binding protein [Burkholderiales bacterium]|nr:AMP-binding protein [Burkholderiales bacterium]